MSLKYCKFIKLPKLTDHRGSLTFIEGENHIPFKVARLYYLYENISNLTRGEHAHRELEQLFIAISGSFDITLNDGSEEKTYHLNLKNIGLYIPPMIWRELNNFSRDAVCMVLASEPYDKLDYINEFSKFKLIKENK